MTATERNRGPRAALCAAVLSAWALALPAADPVAAIQALEAGTTRFGDLALNPDGRHLAWQATRGATPGELFLAAPGETPVRLAAGASPAWSRDGRRLAYLAEDAKGQTQVWVMDLATRLPKAISHLDGYVARLKWSPDGTRLACLLVPGAGGGGPLGARPREVGEIQSVIHNQRIAVLDAGTGEARFGSPGDLNVYAFDWSPDGHAFAFTAAPGPGDNNWWIAQLYLGEADTGSARALYKPRWQIAEPCWSPDGTRIAFLEGLMSDEGSHGGDLMVLPVQGGRPRNLTPGRPATPGGMAWQSATRLTFTEWVGGGSAIAQADLATGAVTRLWQGEECVALGGYETNLSLAAQGNASALVRQGFATPPEVWTGPIGAWQPLTRANAGVKASWGRAESLTWTSEGRPVQGWLVHPAVEEPGRRYPMVVDIHGGPAGVVTPAWYPAGAGLLPLAGYFLFLPNARGSYGQGEAFTQANIRDFGGGDLRDIMAGVDQVLATRSVDPGRLGVCGWSYGGFMTMWAVTQTRRFAAAVAGAGIANWKSYYGENAIDQWMLPFFGASVYDDPEAYARCSPIEFIKQVRTPTLIQVGERDAECPAPQSFEFWHALKALGVPTRLMVYEGEGHEFMDPAHREEVSRRNLAWFDQYLRR